MEAHSFPAENYSVSVKEEDDAGQGWIEPDQQSAEEVTVKIEPDETDEYFQVNSYDLPEENYREELGDGGMPEEAVPDVGPPTSSDQHGGYTIISAGIEASSRREPSTITNTQQTAQEDGAINHETDGGMPEEAVPDVGPPTSSDQHGGYTIIPADGGMPEEAVPDVGPPTSSDQHGGYTIIPAGIEASSRREPSTITNTQQTAQEDGAINHETDGGMPEEAVPDVGPPTSSDQHGGYTIIPAGIEASSRREPSTITDTQPTTQEDGAINQETGDNELDNQRHHNVYHRSLVLYQPGHGEQSNKQAPIQKKITGEFDRYFPVEVYRLVDSAKVRTGPRTVKVHQCEFCDRAFPHACKLKEHRRVHTGERPFKCKHCGKTFTQTGRLTEHERIHTGERPYQCKLCDKAFRAAGTLRQHERLHQGDKPYMCGFCGKTFPLPGRLREHERIHTGIRPYQCDYCGDTFKRSGTLKRHERQHTGERPYKCRYCELSFARTSCLTIHERIHNDDRPFRCEICLKAFVVAGKLKDHKQRVHTKKLTNGDNSGRSLEEHETFITVDTTVEGLDEQEGDIAMDDTPLDTTIVVAGGLE